jgi:uncharacterized protein YbjQ (UPF0145 family)
MDAPGKTYGKSIMDRLQLHHFINPDLDYQGYAFTTKLSSEDFWLVSDRDFQPLELIRGHCIYAIGKLHKLVNAARGTLRGELKEYTAMMYEARRRAFARLQAQADELGADGIIGLAVTAEFIHNHEWFEIMGTGTAVRYVGDNPAILKVLLAARSRFVDSAG